MPTDPHHDHTTDPGTSRQQQPAGGAERPVVRLREVTKSFRGTTLLQDVDADFTPGRIHAVEGPNGSGKSVLFKLVCGFLAPDAGTIDIDPAYTSPRRTFPESFGVLIDRPGYLPHKTGVDNLRSLARIRGVIGDDEIYAAMAAVDLTPSARQPVRNYSLGMKQKLALAQAVMEGQRILVLDEPFNALDTDAVDLVRDLLDRHRADGGTVIFTSHNSEDIDALADHRHRIRATRLEQLT